MSHQNPTRLQTRTNQLATSLMKKTIKIVAAYALWTGARGHFNAQKQVFRAILTPAASLTLAAVLAGCSALPDKPVRPTVYDFGPGAVAGQPANRPAPLPALATLALDEVQASAALDSTAVLYRLAYADAQALKPYAQARWSMTPAQLLRQRLREHLGLRRAVLNAGEGSATVASGAASATAAGTAVAGSATFPVTATATAPALLRIELEEFSQLFESPTASTGLLRLRATAVQPSAQGERLMGQRSLLVQRPAPSADAAGGVRALTAATDAAVDEIDQWLQQLR